MRRASFLRCLPLLGAAIAAVALPPRPALAGGGPMNVLVVYSADDTSAASVADLYASARAIPKGHLCGLPGIKPGMGSVPFATFQTLIQAPVDACLAALPQPDEIDYLVLVRGLPYSVSLPAGAASLEAVLQVGHTTTATSMELAGLGQPGTMNDAAIPNPAFPQGAYFNAADSPPAPGSMTCWVTRSCACSSTGSCCACTAERARRTSPSSCNGRSNMEKRRRPL